MTQGEGSDGESSVGVVARMMTDAGYLTRNLQAFCILAFLILTMMNTIY